MGCRNCTVFLNIQVLSKAFGGADSLPPSAVATAPASPVAPEAEDASRVPPSSTIKMLTRFLKQDSTKLVG
eukprot:symbB.v1.2.031818.t1/scaffold3720.1/size51473/2